MNGFGGKLLRACAAGFGAVLLGGCLSHDQVYLANPNPCHISCEYDYVAPLDPECHGYHPTCWRPWCENCAPCPPPYFNLIPEMPPQESVPTPVPLPQQLPSQEMIPTPSQSPPSLPPSEPENPLRVPDMPPTSSSSSINARGLQTSPLFVKQAEYQMPLYSESPIKVTKQQIQQAQSAHEALHPDDCTRASWWYE